MAYLFYDELIIVGLENKFATPACEFLANTFLEILLVQVGTETSDDAFVADVAMVSDALEPIIVILGKLILVLVNFNLLLL